MLVAVPAVAGVGLGLKAGLNLANMSDLENIDSIDKIVNETKHGFIAGAHLAFPLSSALKLQVEGLYAEKGSSGEASQGLDIEKWENKLTYLEVPLLLKLELPIPAVKPFIYGGGSVAFLLEAEERIRSEWFDITDSLNSTDYGLVIGGGLYVLGLTIEGRYTKGLSDTVEDPDPHSLVQQSRNKVFSVMVGLDLF
jgi:hypothetical protein